MPTDWPLTALAELAAARDEKVLPEPGDSRPYIGLEHIAQGRPKLLGVGRAGDMVSHKTVFRAGDILFGKLRPALRKVVRVEFDGVCSTDILAICPRDPADGPYLQQLLHSESLLARAMRSAEGTKMPRTSWDELRSYRFPCPPRSERVRIGETLGAIDVAIEKTEAVIEATEQLRKGLLQELLTGGVPGWHHKWKHVPGIGTVPACWEVMPLKAVCDRITDGVHGSVRFQPGGPIPFLFVSCIARGFIDWRLATAVSRRTFNEITRGFRPRRHDVLYAAVGSYGTAALVETDAEIAFQRHIAVLRPGDKVSPAFLARILNSEACRRQADDVAVGNAQKTVTLGALCNFLVPIPHRSEQERIAAADSVVKISIDKQRDQLIALGTLRATCAAALLSGRVRVPVGERAAAEATA